MTVDQAQLGRLLPGYDIGDELGRGGSGTVVSGWHRQLQREVAIKQLPPAVTGDPEVRARFVSEARVLAALDHPHIVPVYDFVEADGFCVLVMERLSGGTVWTRFGGAGLSSQTACAIALSVCSGLECAHRKGVLHRDMKPDNLLFSSSGIAKITDFGIARIIGGSATLATREGQVWGTPAYMAPEQALGGVLGPYTDVYATCTMLYELLCGHLPFPDEGDPFSVVYRHVHDQPPPLETVGSSVPAPIAGVVMRGLAAEAGDRYSTAEALGDALRDSAVEVWGPGWLQRLDDVAVPNAIVIDPPVPRVATVTGGHSGRDLRQEQPSGRHPTGYRRRAAAQLGVAICLLLTCVGVAFLTNATGRTSGTIAAERVTIAGRHPQPGVGVAIDLARPVVVSAPVDGHAAGAALSFSVAGVSLGTVNAPTVDAGGGEVTASFDATSERYLVPSGATATVSVRDASAGHASFPVTTAQSAWLTAPGIVTLVLLLFGSAFTESLLRSLLSGRRRVAALPGLAVTGLVLGACVPSLAWVATGRPPTYVAAGVCAVLGSASLCISGIAALTRRPLMKR